VRIAIDSCVWIAYKSRRDVDHGKAVCIVERFLKDKSIRFCMTDYVLVEVTNFLLRKAHPGIAFETLDLFRAYERIEIMVVDNVSLNKSCEIAKKFEVSITDASLVAMMEEFEIDTLYSFDSEFDRIGGIKRENG